MSTTLILYDGAKEMLRRSGINLKTLDVDKLRSGYARLEQRKKELNNIYHTAKKEAKQMNTELNKLKQYLGIEQHNRPSEKNKNEQLRYFLFSYNFPNISIHICFCV